MENCGNGRKLRRWRLNYRISIISPHKVSDKLQKGALVLSHDQSKGVHFHKAFDCSSLTLPGTLNTAQAQSHCPPTQRPWVPQSAGQTSAGGTVGMEVVPTGACRRRPSASQPGVGPAVGAGWAAAESWMMMINGTVGGQGGGVVDMDLK